MKTISIDEIILTFIDYNSDCKKTLLFLHGNSHSHKTFFKQFDSLFFKDYRLVFVDLPGHGESTKVENYSLINFAQIISKFILTLNLSDVIIVGHSMGGHVGINLLKFYTPKALFLYGTPPLKNPFDPNAFLVNPNAIALGQNNSTSEEIETLMCEFKYKDVELSLGITDYLITDPRFRTEILNDIINGINENEFDLINFFKGKTMFLIATSDKLINNEYIISQLCDNKIDFIEIETGHSPHIEASDIFNKILLDFSNSVL
jgi:pimeloyl-ACP methyl ester carboxylesterase